MKTACPLLWNHFCTSVNSVVLPCCRVDQQNNLDGWDNSRVQDGIFSPNHINARKLMREGNRPIACNVCYKKEDLGLKSSRQMYLKKYTDIDYSQEPVKIKTADIKFNNTCNLACRMCGPYSSSLIASFLKNIDKKDRFHNVSIQNYNNKEKEKLEYCKELIKNGLEEFKTTGGEPFYQKYFHKLIDWCIQYNYSKNLTLKITTNGISIDKTILEKMLTFKECHLNISVDGYQNVYEYIRFPGKWSNISKSLETLIQCKENNLFVNISTLLNIYNIFDIPNIERYLASIGYNNNLNIDFYIKPYYQSELNVKNLPRELLKKAITVNTNKELIKYLSGLKKSDQNLILLDEFVRKTKLYDIQRNQSYKILNTNIVELIDRQTSNCI